MRDRQRAKVYRAEGYIDWANKELSYPDVLALARKVFADKRVKERFPKATSQPLCEIDEGRGGGRAWYYYTPDERIVLPPRWRSKRLVLHELAHCLTEREYEGHLDPVHHNEPWCQTYLFLVETFVSMKDRFNLEDAFIVEGVQFKTQ